MNKMKNKETRDHLSGCRKSTRQNLILIHYKNTRQTKSRSKFPQADEGPYDKHAANVILDSERPKAAPQDEKQGTDACSYHI